MTKVMKIRYKPISKIDYFKIMAKLKTNK